MANRFTAIEKWNDPWFCSLGEKDKLFWIYLVDNCDHAGIWQVNFPLVSFHIKDYIFKKEVFNGRIEIINEEIWFIKKFVLFQQKIADLEHLNPENKCHASIIKILVSKGILKDKPLLSSLKAPRKGLGRGLGIGIGIGNKGGIRGETVEFFNYFTLKTKKDFKLTPERAKLIESRISDGFTYEQMRKAVDNFIQDDWEGRPKMLDLVYCIGIRNKIDNLEKWLNYEPKTTPKYKGAAGRDLTNV